MTIDSHQHFWKYNAEEYGWIGEGMNVLKKDYLPADLFPLLKNNSIDGSIAIQARQTLVETDWLLQLAEQNPFIKAVVGWVDLCRTDIDSQLEEFSSYKKLVGVRHVLHDEPDNRFMMREDFLDGIKKLQDYDLTFDLLIFPEHLPVACTFVEKFPEQRFIVNHLAKPLIKESAIQPWADNIKRLARFPNVYCKVSGMVTEGHWPGWKKSDFDPYLDIVFEAFGWERIMFGSDWPVCTLAAEYDQVDQLIVDYIRRNNFSAWAETAIMGGNALEFYGIR